MPDPAQTEILLARLCDRQDRTVEILDLIAQALTIIVKRVSAIEKQLPNPADVA